MCSVYISILRVAETGSETEGSHSETSVFALQLIAGGLLAIVTVVLLFEGVRILREVSAEPRLAHYLLAGVCSVAVAAVVGWLVSRRASRQIGDLQLMGEGGHEW